MNYDFPMLNQLLPDILKASAATGAQVYLVGGSVRDILLVHTPADADFVVFGANYERFARTLAKLMRTVAIPFKDNMRLPCNGTGYIDISAPRGANIEEDLLKRDFTINNLALDMEGNLYGSPDDITAGVIRPVYPQAFDDDPLRILRGYRQAAALGFRLSEEFLKLAADKVNLLDQSASERIYHELQLLALAPSAPDIYRSMADTGVWQKITGGIPPIERLASASFGEDDDSRTAFFLAAAFADYPNPAAVLKRLSASGAVSGLALWLLKESALLTEAGEADTRTIIYKAFTKKRTTQLFKFAALRYGVDSKRWQEIAGMINPTAAELVSGADLLELAPGRKQGPWMAEALENTKIALAYGDIQSRAEALITLSRHCED